MDPYIFRDYWSNRNCYLRNRFEEKWLLDYPGSIAKFLPSELDIETLSSHDRCNVLFKGKRIAKGVINPETILNTLTIEERPLYRESELYFVRRKFFLILRMVFLLITIPPIFWTLTMNTRPTLLIPTIPLLLSSVAWNKLQSIFKSHVSVLIFTAGASLTLMSFFYNMEANKIIIAALASALSLLIADLYFYLVNWILKLQSRYTMITPKEHVHITAILIVAVVIVNITIFLFLPDRVYNANWIGLLLGLLMMICSISFSTHLGKSSKVIVYFYDNSRISPTFPFKIVKGKPVDDIHWLTGRCYWVFRFMYYWLWEFSPSKEFPFLMHPDYERLDVWINAVSGQIEWLVSDYHYRELWYKPPSKEYTIFIDWDDNFHTIVPFTDREQVKCYKELSQIGLTGWKRHFQLQSKLTELQTKTYQQYNKLHPSKNLTQFFRNKEKRAASILASLPWQHCRYEYGAHNDKQGRKTYVIMT